jgi:putative FmdB family regulatory protein
MFDQRLEFNGAGAVPLIMPTYDYRCATCNVVQEFIQSIHKPLPESLLCPKCGCDSFYVFLTAPGVMTAGMSHQSIDVAIGRDAEARWGKINERQAQRDKIRKDSGKSGLTAISRTEFKPNDKKLVAVNTPEPRE